MIYYINSTYSNIVNYTSNPISNNKLAITYSVIASEALASPKLEERRWEAISNILKDCRVALLLAMTICKFILKSTSKYSVKMLLLIKNPPLSPFSKGGCKGDLTCLLNIYDYNVYVFVK